MENAIPINFEPVGTKLERLMASAAVVGKSRRVASSNNTYRAVPFSHYRIFPPLMINIRLEKYRQMAWKNHGLQIIATCGT